MGLAALLELAIAAMTHATELATLYATATAEKRDLTDAEVASVRGKAQAANDRLQAAIDAAKA